MSFKNNPENNINFHVLEDAEHPFPSNTIGVANWLIQVAKIDGKTISNITYIFCSDEYLLDINQKYLGHDYYTDIITFPYKEITDIESDIYISLDRVKDNASEYNVAFQNELLRVIVHGLLHLMGYGDKTEEESILMRLKEDQCIELYDRSKDVS